MPPFINLTGQRFGRLTVLEQIKDSKYTTWECRCSCGNIVPVTTNSLRTKKVQSCGCLRKEVTIKRMTTHGMAKSPEYKTWQHMKDRCYSPTDKSFKDYGGRGIKVCKEWINSFQSFYSYVGDKPSPDHSIDRIDNDGDYEPGNVRWANRTTQNNNSRHNHCITIDGTTKTIAQWAKAMDISRFTILSRLHYGWTPEKSVLHPTRPQRKDIVSINGVAKTTAKWATIVNVRPNLISQRLYRGWPPEQAVFQPVN